MYRRCFSDFIMNLWVHLLDKSKFALSPRSIVFLFFAHEKKRKKKAYVWRDEYTRPKWVQRVSWKPLSRHLIRFAFFPPVIIIIVCTSFASRRRNECYHKELEARRRGTYFHKYMRARVKVSLLPTHNSSLFSKTQRDFCFFFSFS